MARCWCAFQRSARTPPPNCAGQPYQNVVVDDATALGFSFPVAIPSPHEPDLGELSLLLEGLAAFLAEHRRCGEMDSGAEEEFIWMTCTCGAVVSRTLEPAHRP